MWGETPGARSIWTIISASSRQFRELVLLNTGRHMTPSSSVPNFPHDSHAPGSLPPCPEPGHAPALPLWVLLWQFATCLLSCQSTSRANFKFFVYHSFIPTIAAKTRMRGLSAKRRKWVSCFKLLSKGRSLNPHTLSGTGPLSSFWPALPQTGRTLVTQGDGYISQGAEPLEVEGMNSEA